MTSKCAKKKTVLHEPQARLSSISQKFFNFPFRTLPIEFYISVKDFPKSLRTWFLFLVPLLISRNLFHFFFTKLLSDCSICVQSWYYFLLNRKLKDFVFEVNAAGAVELVAMKSMEG